MMAHRVGSWSLVLIASLAPSNLARAQGPNPLNLWLVDLRWTGNRLSAGTPVKLTRDNGTNSQPAFTPDGRAIVFSATRDTGSDARSDIYRIDLTTKAETRVTRTPEHENSPTVNERGEYVAVRWQPATLFKEFGPWVYSADGTPKQGVLRAPDTTGYYTPLPNGDYALTRPKSKTFTIGLFNAKSGAITDVDSGVPALPAQRIPGEAALSYVRIDSMNGRHSIRRFDLATHKTTVIGPTVVGRTAHAWVAGRRTILMAKGHVLYARTTDEQAWRVVATFDNPELRNASAYVVSPQGDKLILTSPKRLGLATVLRDSLEAGRSGADVAGLTLAWRDAGQLRDFDVTEGPISALGDDRLQKKRFADAIAMHTLATTLFPTSHRAFARLGDAQRATGDSSAALVSYRKSLEVNPRSTEAERAAAAAVEKKVAPDKPSPTFDWVFSDEIRRAAALPTTTWLSNNTLMFYDSRVPAAERRFEIIDPATGARRDAFDVGAALQSLGALLPAGQAPRSLGWPESFDAAGKHALYTLGGDLFVLDVIASRFTRLTRSDSAEHSAEFSPDGSRLAFVRANDLYVVDLGTRAETRLTRDGTATTLNGTLSWLYWEEVFGRRDIGYWWSPDSKSLAYLQTDDSKVDVMTFVDHGPLTPRVITQRYPKAGRPNPKARVGVVSATGGATTWVRITDKPFDTILRVKWLPDSRRVSVQTMTRDQREVGLYFADRASGSATRVLTETDPGYVNIHDDLHFLPGGKEFLWASERDGNYHIYRYVILSEGRSPESKNRHPPERGSTLINQVTRGSWSLASSGGVFWVRQAVAGLDGDWMYFTAMEKSSVERHLYRIRLDGTSMTRVSREDGVHRVTMSPNASFYLDAYSDARTLPSLTLRRTDESASRTLATPRMELFAKVDVQYPELTTIPTRDGFAMPARILKPRNFRADAKHPVVMAVYGGASSATVTNAWQSDMLFYQLLLAEGYVVVKVDNRTATAISKSLENLVVGRLGDTETADLSDAARWLKQQPWVDSSRVGVWGWSNGGYVTLQLMTRSKEFKAGIAVAPVTDWRFYDSKWAEALTGGMPDENPRAYDSASVVTRAANLHGRLLVVHGTYDDNVQPQNTQAFFDALIKAGKTFEMMYYPMRKHDIGDRDANVHLYRTMLEFWKRSL